MPQSFRWYRRQGNEHSAPVSLDFCSHSGFCRRCLFAIDVVSTVHIHRGAPGPRVPPLLRLADHHSSTKSSASLVQALGFEPRIQVERLAECRYYLAPFWHSAFLELEAPPPYRVSKHEAWHGFRRCHASTPAVAALDPRRSHDCFWHHSFEAP